MPVAMMMNPVHRRAALLAATALLASMLLAACSTLGAVGALLGNQVTFTAPQLQNQLDRRFPREYEKLGGRMNDRVRDALNRWLADYALDEPVYRLDDNLLGRIAGRRIGRTDIGDGVVTLHLDQ